VLGVSSGASLGAAIALLLGLNFAFFGLGAVTPLAFGGAMLALLAVLIISRRVAGQSTLGLLLAGIAMNSALSAVVSFLVLLSRERINPLLFWLMGGFAGRGWSHLVLMLPYLLVGLAIACLGAAIALLLGLNFVFFGLGAVTPLAFGGAMLALLAVLIISRRVAGQSTLGLLLAGIAMNSALSAVVSFLVLLSRERINPLLFWLMGGFAGRGWSHLVLMLPYLLVGLAIAYAYHRHLTAISLGDATAHHLGVDVSRVRLLLLGTAALLTAAAVSVSGMIGFVGLMTPHFARMLVGHHYRRLLPTAALCGAIFLTCADLLARVVMRPQELPVGIITALCGGPFFLWLLSRQRREVA